MSNWIIALKKWNEGKPSWCMPKRGTVGYNQVKAIMETLPKKPTKKPTKVKTVKKTPELELKNLMVEMVNKFSNQKIKNIKLTNKEDLEKIFDEYNNIAEKIDKLNKEINDNVEFIKSLPEVIKKNYPDTTKNFLRRIKANYKKNKIK